ncbi:hypothetical protein PVK06_034679 [Gossypium arboreum]|uniref:Uncharacterized protein n=1 Tax=Gossypium arboreum TaxID=29729 RepID=A0ABR0NFF4_GOSAR|nr:hypothetical protein PVK06_034679 [Gossypium arboreum]
MANDGVTTRLQKELESLQHELSQLESQFDAKLDIKLDAHFKEFRDEIKGEIRGSGAIVIREFQLTYLQFDSTNFCGWWSKLEQFFEAKNVEEMTKRLTWEVYAQTFQEQFGSHRHLDPMNELMALK